MGVVTAHDLISQRVVTGRADERLAEIVPRLHRPGIHHCVVLDDAGAKFLGLVQFAEVAARSLAGNRILADLVSPTQPVVVGRGEPALAVAQLFARHQLNEAVVVGENGAYAGLITAQSVCEWSLGEQERAAELLGQREVRLRVATDAAGLGLFTWQLGPDAPAWENARMLELLGRDARTPPSAREFFAEIVAAEDAALFRRELTVESPRTGAFFCVCRLRVGGQLRTVEFAGSVDGETAEAKRVVGIAADITDRKNAEEALREAREEGEAVARAKRNFLAAMSHELRTPLTPVLLLASTEAANPELPEAVRRSFAVIAENVAHEARLVDALLDQRLLSRGRVPLNRAWISLHSLLQEVKAEAGPQIAAKRIDATLELAEGDPLVWADRPRLRQAFAQLLDNAIKFTPSAGKITVTSTLRSQQQTVTVTLADNGIGLTAAEIERAFRPFERGDHAQNPIYQEFGGLGLGLSLARRIIELHDGEIRVSSAGRDQGAIFAVTLSLTKEAARAEGWFQLRPPNDGPDASR